MPDETEVIRQQMQQTRSDLTEKLETLEQKVVETVSEANTAVTETVENVKEAVEETVETVKGTVSETVESVREAFDLSRQMDRHPWLFFGGSVAAGYFVGSLLPSAESVRAAWPSSAGTYSGESHREVGNGAGGYAHYEPAPVASPHREEKRGLFSGLGKELSVEVDKLKSLALGMGLAAVRDLIAQAVPEQVRPRVTEIANDLTSRIGGEVMREPVLGGAPEHTPR